MIKALVVILGLAVMPGITLGQGKQTLEETLQEISKDLAGLHQEVQAAYQAQTTQSLVFPFAAGNYRIRITRDGSPIRAGADDTAWVLIKASQGTSFKVVDKVSDWYAVALEKPTKGLSSGWVKAALATPEFQFGEVMVPFGPTEMGSGLVLTHPGIF